PGFFPAFNSIGICVTNPVRFTDATSTVYGVVDTWSWNFGDATTAGDTSHIKNPQYTYPNSGPKDITLIVTNSKGCVDTVTNRVDVIDKPPISLAFRDTLICVPDAVQLGAAGNGVFSWTPVSNISNPNIPNPTVNPSTTTVYYVDLDLSGCRNRDSVRVRVTNSVSLSVRADTTSCQGDPVQLMTTSNGLTYQWSPAASLNDPTVKNPIASPTTTTTYQVLAKVGSCSAVDQVTIFTVPYPFVNAGPDTIVCYNTAAQLFGTFSGTSFSWAPANFLSNPNIVNPVAQPPRTTTFTLTVFDTLGCPKPGKDSVKVTVLPRVRANAGRDTVVVVGEPLQFDGTGGTGYLWSPPTGLSDVTIRNPVGIYGAEIDSVRYKLIVTDQAGCADSAFVQVKVFKTNPSIFVPSAFTPNGDGLNDVIAPIGVGIRKIFYFSIYNRWGQRVFITSENGRGWDGRINGRAQASDVFVWMVNAQDYLGRNIFMKGTVALIR
ncbi:MAG TPA: PKD domain-containing protein, partial [Chitinophagaceae bacterium]|nr:PKD domain-containing protein [Chitinophagaceae bacterium]